ncbi:MAG: ribonuclease HII [Candidatus Omnitrophota bacterium]
MLYHENKAKKKGFKFIIGVDEAGRGPLAGPVVASAVLLVDKRFRNRIDDSKKLTAMQREKAFREIITKSIFGLGVVSEDHIDQINILEATRLAMRNAILDLILHLEKKKGFKRNRLKKQVCVLVDGNILDLDVPCYTKNIIKGDSKSLSIACASIVAKFTRDRMMLLLDRIHPQYGFSKHKGYGTKRHLKALKRHGPSVFHRKSFSPVKCLDRK